MKRILALLAALSVLGASGYVHGVWTERWQKSGELERALTRVDLVPMKVGTWEAKALEADAETFRRAGAQKYWVRQYTDTLTNTNATVILMCGRAGRMSVHTPEVCWQGVGFGMAEAPTVMTLPPGAGSLWTAKFLKASDSNTDLQLLWGWNSSGEWQAPTNPRWQYRGLPFLYKLYVIREATSAPTDVDPLSDFLAELTPALRKALFPVAK
jgi:hypothetical protein